MNLHEYQAKNILKKYGVPIPEFEVVASMEEVQHAIKKLHLKEAVIKIQVHAGGRGKSGGVQFGKTPEEIVKHAHRLLGMNMINEQTGPDGVIAQKLMLTKPVSIHKEYYLGAVVDRNRGVPLLIASSEGGMDIEQVARTNPERVIKIPFALDGTLRPYQILTLCKCMGWSKELAKQGAVVAQAIARCFIQSDASLLEINPLIVSEEGQMWALDAKLAIDDNALFRHAELLDFYDPAQGSAQEAAAKQFDLAYIPMQGEIGCMVNGAGLAMATMDIIQLYGSSPANFLDVGGSASKEKISEGFRIILSDPKVKAVLVNIFGGIMNCATLAEGILLAAKELKIRVPLVVRMEGTNVDKGKELLKNSRLNIISATDLNEAAQLAVQSARR